MATTVNKPLSEAEAYVVEGAREISERLQDLILQHRRPRRRSADLVRAAADHPIAAGSAFVIGAILAAFLADRLFRPAR
ncbi:MAG TPA: hypothetical protein VL358_08530 [Caulobacteraceae bacterium]|jgi:hypothetical protein|nr:hypothetical protein [Caulobacteraceae bacterium]